MIPIAYNVRSLTRRWRTTIATASGVALVVFVLSSALMLSQGIQAAMGLSARDDAIIVLKKGADSEFGSAIKQSDAGIILSAPGVQQDDQGAPLGVAESMVVSALEKLGAPDGQVSNILVRGISEQSMSFRPEVRIVEGRALRPGTDEAIVGIRLRGRFPGLEVGDSFELRKNRSLKVVGVFESAGTSYESEIWADGDTVRSAFGREGVVSSVRARLTTPDGFEAVRAQLEGDKRLGLLVKREREFLQQQSEGITIFVTVLGTLIAVFFSLGATIGAMITMYAAVEQRQREVGVLRALGFSRWTILCSFMLESSILALMGGAVGALASLAMGNVEFAMVNFATWAEIVISFTPSGQTVGVAFFVACIMGLVGGFFPALRAIRISPIEALRS
jgi:putative ABC transport system permease protein